MKLVMQVQQMGDCKFGKSKQMNKLQEYQDYNRRKKNFFLGMDCQGDTDSQIKIGGVNRLEANKDSGFMNPNRDKGYNPWCKREVPVMIACWAKSTSDKNHSFRYVLNQTSET